MIRGDRLKPSNACYICGNPTNESDYACDYHKNMVVNE